MAGTVRRRVGTARSTTSGASSRRPRGAPTRPTAAGSLEVAVRRSVAKCHSFAARCQRHRTSPRAHGRRHAARLTPFRRFTPGAARARGADETETGEEPETTRSTAISPPPHSSAGWLLSRLPGPWWSTEKAFWTRSLRLLAKAEALGSIGYKSTVDVDDGSTGGNRLEAVSRPRTAGCSETPDRGGQS